MFTSLFSQNSQQAGHLTCYLTPAVMIRSVYLIYNLMHMKPLIESLVFDSYITFPNNLHSRKHSLTRALVSVPIFFSELPMRKLTSIIPKNDLSIKRTQQFHFQFRLELKKSVRCGAARKQFFCWLAVDHRGSRVQVEICAQPST